MYKKTAIFLIMIFYFCAISAQVGDLKGVVLDNGDERVVGATVTARKGKLAAVTDLDGRFLLSGVHYGDSVTISFLGLKTHYLLYKGQKFVHIRMKEDSQLLGQVEVVAKANINAIDLRAKSGIVHDVNMRRVLEKPTTDIAMSLQGSVPGLNVTNTGDLGKLPKIRLRGNSSLRRGDLTNEPLYVMDGQIIKPETFFNLNPADIDGIKVLKDAAACALYGVKAANGVIEISSKRGNKGVTSVTYSMNMGLTTRGRRGVKMMNSAEKLELERRMGDPATPGYRYSDDYIMKHYKNSPELEARLAEGRMELERLRGINTDWFKQLVRPNFYNRHNLSVRGGNDATSYFLSANYSSQGGRVKGNKRERMGVRMNLDQKLGDKGWLMIGVSGGSGKTKTPNGSSNSPTSLVYELNPYETKSDKLWSYPRYKFDDLMHQYSSESESKDAGINSSLTYTPIPGLDLMASTGLSYSFTESSHFTPSTAISEIMSGVPEVARGIFSKSKSSTLNMSTNVRATYNKVFGEVHDLTLGANADYFLYKFDNVSMRGYGVGEINSAAAINQSLQGSRQPKVSGPKDKNAQLGLGLVAGYTYNMLYDFYATYKADASSVLPADKRWNGAWGVGLGWNISNHAFLKDNSVLTELSVKTSFGRMANLSGVTASSTTGTFAYSTESYEDIRPLYMIQLYNKDLKPEQTESVDLSLSAQLFKRFNLGINWYRRTTIDALLDVPIPSSSGYTSLRRNIGSLKNEGLEMRLRARVMDAAASSLVLGASLAYNRNEVLDLYDGDKLYVSPESLVPDYEVGKAYDVLYGAKSLGINPMTGYPVFLTPDGREKQATEKLTRDDVQSLGHTVPPYTGTLNLSWNVGNFSLDVDFYYVLGGVRRFNYSYVRNRGTVMKNAVSGQVDKMWFKPGDEDKEYWTPFFTSATAEDNIALYPNSRSVGKSDYLRLSMVSLRYKFSRNFLEDHLPFVKYANIAFQGSNLFTWTGYKESDPESGTLAGTIQPVYTLNLNITF